VETYEDRRRFVLVQGQRWKRSARSERIATSNARRPVDGITEAPQALDIATQRARRDLEPLRELGASAEDGLCPQWVSESCRIESTQLEADAPKEVVMKLASVRLVAADIKKMVGFYEMVTGVSAQWLAPVFAEIVTPGATLAIGSVETIALWKEGSAQPGANRTAYLEFQVEDIESHYERLKGKVQLVHELKTMPWGNKTFPFRDPEGTAVSLYMPATDAARERFASR
jgi:uncharacterized glyoxalase superfamily protein PhnB